MQNRLLNALPPADLRLLFPHLSHVELPTRYVFQPADSEIRQVFFLERGLASFVAVSGEHRIEVSMMGREGVTGVPVMLGETRTPHEGFMQVGGSGQAIAVEALRGAMAKSPSLADLLRRFVHLQFLQVAQTALANGRCTVEQRLARWLLMAHDRLGRDEIELTHEFLALMLGVRRPGVTVSLHLLEGAHAIRARRGLIIMRDREKLMAIAGPSYGTAEERLEIGSLAAAG